MAVAAAARRRNGASSENVAAFGEQLPSRGGDLRRLDELLAAMRACAAGDFSVRLSPRRHGPLGEIASAFNRLAATNQRMAREMARVRRVIGREGRMTVRAQLPGAAGSWAASIDSVNALIDDLVRPTTEVAR